MAAQDFIVSEAKSLAPARTGFLRDSIHAEEMEEPGKTLVAPVVADAPYAVYVEFGTSRMAAQPFLRRIYRQTHDFKLTLRLLWVDRSPVIEGVGIVRVT